MKRSFSWIMTLDDTITKDEFDAYKTVTRKQLELKDRQISEHNYCMIGFTCGISSSFLSMVSAWNLYDRNYGYGTLAGIAAILTAYGLVTSIGEFFDNSSRMSTLEKEINASQDHQR